MMLVNDISFNSIVCRFQYRSGYLLTYDLCPRHITDNFINITSYD